MILNLSLSDIYNKEAIDFSDKKLPCLPDINGLLNLTQFLHDFNK